MTDRVAEAISEASLDWRNLRPGAETISEQQCRWIAATLADEGLCRYQVESAEALSALTPGTLVLVNNRPHWVQMIDGFDGPYLGITDMNYIEEPVHLPVTALWQPEEQA